MKYFHLFTVVLFVSTTVFSCSSTKNNSQKKEMDFSGPPTIIYKTNKDYSTYVPVTMSEDKSKIISYPGIKDIYYKGKLSYPIKLDKGYYLDNRGLSLNSVFTSYTYEEYSKLSKVPTLAELLERIMDKDPIIEFYNCGNRFKYKDEVAELNKLIDSNELSKCKCLKGKK